MYVLPYQLDLILHQFARCPPGLNVAQFSCDTFCLLLFPCHVLHAVARATLWSHLCLKKSGAALPTFRCLLLGFSVPSQICADVSLDTVFFNKL